MSADKLIEQISRAELVSLASELVSIPSFKGEETPLALFLSGWFSERGYQVELDEVEPDRFQTIATLKGIGGGRSLMFNAHMDINSLTRGWTRDPWEAWVDGDKLFGHGIQNMKGGLATMMVAADAFRKTETTLKGDIVLACVVGETQGGEGTHHLMSRGFRTDAAVITEPFGRGNVATMHAGIVHLALHVRGRSGHMSQLKGTIHAIRKMASIIEHLDTLKFAVAFNQELPGLPRHNIGAIIGGRGDNYVLVDAPYVPDLCTIILDVHFLPGQTVQSIVDEIEAHLAPLAEADADLQFDLEVPPPAFFEGRRRLVMPAVDVPETEEIVSTVIEKYECVSGKKINKVGAVLPSSYSACDSSWLWQQGIPCLNYGPSTGMHLGGPEGAFCLIDEMEEVAKVLALTALEFCEAA